MMDQSRGGGVLNKEYLGMYDDDDESFISGGYRNNDNSNMNDEILIKESIINTWNDGLYKELYGGAESDEGEEGGYIGNESTYECLKDFFEKAEKVSSSKGSKLYEDRRKSFRQHILTIKAIEKDGRQYREYSFGEDAKGCLTCEVPLVTTLPTKLEELDGKVNRTKENLIRLYLDHLFDFADDKIVSDMTNDCVDECDRYMSEYIEVRTKYNNLQDLGNVSLKELRKKLISIEKVIDRKSADKEEIEIEIAEKKKINKIIGLAEEKMKMIIDLKNIKRSDKDSSRVKANMRIMEKDKELREARFEKTEILIKDRKVKKPKKDSDVPEGIENVTYQEDYGDQERVDDDTGTVVASRIENDDDNDDDDDDYDDEVEDNVIKQKVYYLDQKAFTEEKLETFMQSGSEEKCFVNSTYSMCIVVPFRSDNKGDERAMQLEIFKKSMNKFLTKVHNAFVRKSVNATLSLVIVTQTNDGEKFNRGALLNVGYLMHDDSTVYVFHDVDLIPQDNMVETYATVYHENSLVHFAGGWERYTSQRKNYNYIGGVTLIGNRLFKDINGFPNDYQGWGGEDDEIWRRLVSIEKEMLLERVKKPDGYVDLEDLKTAKEKLDKLTEKTKNMEKFELAAQHESTWKMNGISLKLEEITKNTKNKKEKVIEYDYYTLYEDLVTINLAKILATKYSNNNLPKSSYASSSECSSNNSKLPYITSVKDFELIISEMNLEGNHNDNKLQGSDKNALPEIFQCGPGKKYTKDDVMRTYKYMFEHIRLGVFIMIKESKLEYFIPFQNIYYKNDWDINNFSFRVKGGRNVSGQRGKEQYERNRNDINNDFSEWSANDCVLGTWRGNKEGADGNEVGDQGWNEMRDMIETVCKNGNVRNSVFFFNRRDFPIVTSNRSEPYKHIYGDKGLSEKYISSKGYFVPIVGYCNHDGYDDILVPNYADWRLANSRKFFPSSCSDSSNDAELLIKNRKEWKKKEEGIVFRGSATGCGIDAKTNKRIAAAELAYRVGYKVTLNDGTEIPLNVKLTGCNFRDKVYGRSGEKALVGRYDSKDCSKVSDKKKMNTEQQMNYKYVLHIDGHVAAYRLGRELGYNSCILKMKGYNDYNVWFSNKLVPYNTVTDNLDGDPNYYPIDIDADTNNTEEEGSDSIFIFGIKRIAEKPIASAEIAKNSRKLFEEIMNEKYMVEYMRGVLEKVSTCF
jgi:hypothetical protein